MSRQVCDSIRAVIRCLWIVKGVDEARDLENVQTCDNAGQ